MITCDGCEKPLTLGGDGRVLRVAVEGHIKQRDVHVCTLCEGEMNAALAQTLNAFFRWAPKPKEP